MWCGREGVVVWCGGDVAGGVTWECVDHFLYFLFMDFDVVLSSPSTSSPHVTSQVITIKQQCLYPLHSHCIHGAYVALS